MTKEFGGVETERGIVINCEAAVYIRNVDESSTLLVEDYETFVRRL